MPETIHAYGGGISPNAEKDHVTETDIAGIPAQQIPTFGQGNEEKDRNEKAQKKERGAKKGKGNQKENGGQKDKEGCLGGFRFALILVFHSSFPNRG
jgi:hypothetical protein